MLVVAVSFLVAAVSFLATIVLLGKWWREGAQRKAYLFDEREKEKIKLEHERRMKQLTWEQEHPDEVRKKEIMRRREEARDMVRKRLHHEMKSIWNFFGKLDAALMLEKKEKQWAKEDRHY